MQVTLLVLLMVGGAMVGYTLSQLLMKNTGSLEYKLLTGSCTLVGSLLAYTLMELLIK